MRNKSLLLLATVLVLLAGCSARRPAAPKDSTSNAGAANLPDPQPYTRIARPDSNTVQLQIAVRRFVPVDHKGPVIWLTATAHIGEPEYYHALQRHLDSRTVVLYEGVNADAHARHVPRKGETPAPSQARAARVADAKEGFSMQSELAKSLGLVFQLEAIDYERTNFLNSDLSVLQIQRLMLGDPDAQPARAGEKGRADPTLQTLLQIMDGSSFLGALMKGFVHLIGSSPQLQAAAKLVLIETLGRIKGDMAEMRGLPAGLRHLMQVLIEARNQSVIEDLKTEIKAVPRSGSISVFYGSGHMENMEKHITTELHYRPDGEVWLPAFSVDLQKTGMSNGDLQMIRNLVKWQLETMQSR
jgi:hypothetical protein